MSLRASFLIKVLTVTALASILFLSLVPTLFAAESTFLGSGPNSQSTFPGSGSKTGVVTIPNPLGVNSIAALINRIATWLLLIGAPILTLMILIGAFQIMMAGGSNPENIIKGKHTITYAIIGYALLLLSTGITSIIESVLKN